MKSFLCRLSVSTSFSSSGVFYFPLSRPYSSATSCCPNCSLYSYVCHGLVMFLNLGTWPSVGSILCIPAVHAPLFTQAVHSRGSSKRAACTFVLQGTDYVGGLVGFVGPWSGWFPGPPALCGSSVCRWAEPFSEVAGCGTLGSPGATPGLLVVGVRVLKNLGLLPTPGRLSQNLGLGRLLAGRGVS